MNAKASINTIQDIARQLDKVNGQDGGFIRVTPDQAKMLTEALKMYAKYITATIELSLRSSMPAIPVNTHRKAKKSMLDRIRALLENDEITISSNPLNPYLEDGGKPVGVFSDLALGTPDPLLSNPNWARYTFDPISLNDGDSVELVEEIKDDILKVTQVKVIRGDDSSHERTIPVQEDYPGVYRIEVPGAAFNPSVATTETQEIATDTEIAICPSCAFKNEVATLAIPGEVSFSSCKKKLQLTWGELFTSKFVDVKLTGGK